MKNHKSSSKRDNRAVHPAGKPATPKGPASVTYQPESGQPGEREVRGPQPERKS